MPKTKEAYSAPSERCKKAFDLAIHKNHGNISKSMREAGFSAASAKNPNFLVKTRGWKELMQKYVSEELLAETHHNALKAKKLYIIDKGKHYEPDHDARIKALDLGYKLRGKYAPEQIELTKRKYQDLSPEELSIKIESLKMFFLKKG
jgi:hypothetical protein